jgi:hypothetical protein
MNPENVGQKYDDALAEEYIQRALTEGRSEDDGLWDYLEQELGIRRPERTDEVLKEVAAMQRRAIENLLNGLVKALSDAMAIAPSAAPEALPIALNFAGNHANELVEKLKCSSDPQLKPVKKLLDANPELLLTK